MPRAADAPTEQREKQALQAAEQAPRERPVPREPRDRSAAAPRRYRGHFASAAPREKRRATPSRTQPPTQHIHGRPKRPTIQNRKAPKPNTLSKASCNHFCMANCRSRVRNASFATPPSPKRFHTAKKRLRNGATKQLTHNTVKNPACLVSPGRWPAVQHGL